MEIVLRLLRSPLIRLVGAVTILYYALFANTYDKDSLGNRLSKKTIEKNIEEAKRKSLYIAVNVKQAQDYKRNQTSDHSPSNPNLKNQNSNSRAGLIIKDIETRPGTKVKCGDKITADYVIYDNDGNQLNNITNYITEINENSAKSIVKENLIGLGVGGKRLIIIPETYKTKDEESSKYMVLSHNKGINYEIKLLKVEESGNAEAKCNWSSENTIFLH